jgi:hypothetical protein
MALICACASIRSHPFLLVMRSLSGFCTSPKRRRHLHLSPNFGVLFRNDAQEDMIASLEVHL